MSLRKSPERTPALLAASRTNGRQFKGSRSMSRRGRRELLNGLRDGGRLARSLEILARAPLPLQLDFARLYASLHQAVAPEPGEVDLVVAAAAFVWRVKRRMENRVRSPRFKAQVAQGRLPPAWRMPLQRPGGQVTVTIWVRPRRTGLASGAGAPTHFHVGLTIRRDGRRPWQACDGPRNSAVPSSSPDPAQSGAEEALSGRSDGVLHPGTVEIDAGNEGCNRNSLDKVTVPFVKHEKIALQAGMSKFFNSVRSYLRGLTGKTEDSE